MAELKSKNKTLESAEEALETVSQDSLTRLEYDKRRAAFFFNEMNLREQYKKGVEEGSYFARCKTAKAMIMRKLDLNTISEVTDLPMDTIRELAREAETI